VEPFGLVFSEAAAARLVAASRAEQRKVAAILDGIKAAPGRPGDLQEWDAQGRKNEVLVVDDWIVTFWPDDAVREVRIVRLERVED